MKTILQHNDIDCGGFEGAIICSVVPPLTEIFRTAVQKLTGHKALVVGAGIKTGLNILIEDPASLGSDLVAAAVAAIAQFP
jgi:type III pantothenate kinase